MEILSTWIDSSLPLGKCPEAGKSNLSNTIADGVILPELIHFEVSKKHILGRMNQESSIKL